MKKMINLSLIIACYNEKSHLENNFRKINWILSNLKVPYEIIFVEDFSDDGTRGVIRKIVKEFPDVDIVTIFHKENIGRGGSVAEGIKIAKGEIVGFLDVDLEVSEQYIPAFYWRIKEGYDMAIGKRSYEFTPSKIIRFITSRGYAYLVKRLLKLPFQDTEAGYKFFNRRKILPVINMTHDKKWFWDTEIVVRSLKSKLKIAEIPIIFVRNPQKKSTVKIIPDSIDYFLKLWQFRKEL
jgi:glycosyltransferase involved in cell wall biosynthesis